MIRTATPGIHFGQPAALLVALVLTCSSATAQQAPTTLRGTWTATASGRVLNGSWTAEVGPATPNTARGSWAVLDNSNRIVLQGTWSAQKRARVWEGTWSAVVVTRSGGRSSSGPPLTGTWRANVDSTETSSTLLEILKHSLENSVSGTWRSGHLEGQWTVKASPQ